MATGRDSLFVRSTLFTKQVHIYACEIQIKPRPYPLSCDRYVVYHHYRTADTALIAPVNTKLNKSGEISEGRKSGNYVHSLCLTNEFTCSIA